MKLCNEHKFKNIINLQNKLKKILNKYVEFGYKLNFKIPKRVWKL